jgi:hypothetical protein
MRSGGQNGRILSAQPQPPPMVEDDDSSDDDDDDDDAVVQKDGTLQVKIRLESPFRRKRLRNIYFILQVLPKH